MKIAFDCWDDASQEYYDDTTYGKTHDFNLPEFIIKNSKYVYTVQCKKCGMSCAASVITDTFMINVAPYSCENWIMRQVLL